jgi:hypothetical protein
MNVLGKFLMAVLFSGMPPFSAWAEGGMTVSLATGDNPIKARAFIVDPQGRRFGRDPGTGVSYYEVPRIGYDLSSIGADDASGDATPEVEVFFIRPLMAGNYKITVYALAPSSYTLVVGSSNDNRKAFPTIEVSGTLQKEGESSSYHYIVDPTPGAPDPVLLKEP